jgi:hypothetical protein
MVTWNEARNSADRLYKILLSQDVDNCTEVVYNGNLPRLMSLIFEVAYIQDYDRSTEDMQVLLKATKQLTKKGCI